MARSRSAVLERVPLDEHDAVIAEYRERLSRPVIMPVWDYPPVHLGPTWKVGADGRWV